MVSLEFRHLHRANVVRLIRGHEGGIVYLKLPNITFCMARGLKPSPGLRIGGGLRPPLDLKSGAAGGLKPPPGPQIGGGLSPPLRGFQAPPGAILATPLYAPCISQLRVSR